MHRELMIDNFKCFSEPTKIKLGKINVCLGSNSVGKSSVIQSCILIRQIYEQAKMFKDTKVKNYRIQLNDVYGLQLGDSEHIKSSKDKEEIILKIDQYKFQLISLDESLMEMEIENECDAAEMSLRGGIFSEDFYYLNAERIGPRNYQMIDSKMVNNCGVYGENTIHLLNKLGNSRVDDQKCFDLNQDKRVNTLNKQVEYWMDYVIPGIEMSTDDVMDLRISKITFRQPELDTGFLSPYNFGFGISYVLPVILTGLIAKQGSMILVENPEAHLHPKGQSHIGYFLAMVAYSGVQIIVETHSEHVLNGIRIAALKNGIDPEDILELLDYIKDHNIENMICESTWGDAELWDWLCSKSQIELNDIKKELMLRIEKVDSIRIEEYEEISNMVGKLSEIKTLRLLFDPKDDFCVLTMAEYYIGMRKYLVMEKKDAFCRDLPDCFPNISFSKDIGRTVNTLNRRFEELREEIIEHLTQINNYHSKFTQLLSENASFQIVAQRFTADTGIECSPQAGRDKVQALKEKCLNTESGMEEIVICELHTKFKKFNIDRNSQDRIYFYPGKKGILEGKIIVKHIGKHL